ncbi:hypothetical protein [Paraburkholderia kururiensis]|jgi:hypothetical protein|uniref:hypothetical protein n=1 Tax=Paraburkholderia kururiensis TaxID=984307 RepID=UPI0018F55F8B|nr:hypothetical protein [Paraburkholderia kururiensis]
MAKPKSTAPDILGQAMTAIIGAFSVLMSAGLHPVVAFLLPAVVAVLLLRR